MRRTASEVLRDLEIRIAQLEKSSSLLRRTTDPNEDAENLENFRVRLRGLVSILTSEKPHSLAKELQDILETYAKADSPRKVETIRLAVLKVLNLGQAVGLRTTASSRIAPSNFKGDNLRKTKGLLLKLLDHPLISSEGMRLATSLERTAYTPKHPSSDPRNADLINYILNNEIIKFTPRGSLSGRAGVYYYPIGFGSRNPPVSLYLSGRKIAIMEWNGRKWETYLDENLKDIRLNPNLLDRWFRVMSRKVERAKASR